jgi:hypothetical protein
MCFREIYFAAQLCSKAALCYVFSRFNLILDLRIEDIYTILLDKRGQENLINLFKRLLSTIHYQ